MTDPTPKARRSTLLLGAMVAAAPSAAAWVAGSRGNGLLVLVVAASVGVATAAVAVVSLFFLLIPSRRKKAAANLGGCLASALFFVGAPYGLERAAFHRGLALTRERGEAIAKRLEEHRSAHGDYPESLSALGRVPPPQLDPEGWHYVKGDGCFVLQFATGSTTDVFTWETGSNAWDPEGPRRCR